MFFRVFDTVRTLPAAAAHRLGIVLRQRIDAADDKLWWCYQQSAGTYAWKELSSAAGGKVKTATLAFGANPTTDKTFTVTDADIASTSKIIASISWFTGFSRDMDEVMADPILLNCQPAAGSMSVRTQAYLSSVQGDYPLVYLITA